MLSAQAGSLIMILLLSVLPAVMHVLQGGFAGSAAVLSWTVVSPPLSVILLRSRRSLIGFFCVTMLSFVVGVVLTETGVPEQFSESLRNEALTGGLKSLFFCLNLLVPSVILLGALFYYELRLAHEEKVSRRLVEEILPARIADKLRAGVPREELVEHYDNVAIFFSDIVGYTALSSQNEAREIVALLNHLYARMDRFAGIVARAFTVFFSALPTFMLTEMHQPKNKCTKSPQLATPIFALPARRTSSTQPRARGALRSLRCASCCSWSS